MSQENITMEDLQCIIVGMKEFQSLQSKQIAQLFSKLEKSEKTVEALTSHISQLATKVEEPNYWREKLNQTKKSLTETIEQVESNCMGEILHLRQLQQEMKLREKVEVESVELVKKTHENLTAEVLSQRIQELENAMETVQYHLHTTTPQKLEELSDHIINVHFALFNPHTQSGALDKISKDLGLHPPVKYSSKTTSRWGNTFTTRQGDDNEVRINELESMMKAYMKALSTVSNDTLKLLDR